jgi:hypothetical protein
MFVKVKANKKRMFVFMFVFEFVCMFVCLYVCMDVCMFVFEFVCMFVEVKTDKKRMCKSCSYILPCPLGSTLNMEVKVLKRDLHIFYY